MRIETAVIHAGRDTDPATGAITQPIYPSTTYERAPDGSYESGYDYIRGGNPNRNALEVCLATLEDGARAAMFASGMAASTSILHALDAGDHVILPLDLYFGVKTLQRDVFERWGLRATTVDMTDHGAIERAITGATKLIWIETPSNPRVEVVDIAAIASVAQRAGARSVCDNTWATPVLQRPLELGVDLVVHSTTKYLGGHGDVMGGAVVAKSADDFFARIRAIQSTAGAVPSPFDCWLTLRGVQTLPVRVRAQSEHAMRIAMFLDAHAAVETVHYPGLEAHPRREIAAAQMEMFGAMVSFDVVGGKAEAMAVAGRLTLIKRATSLGGTHSLIEHRASIEGSDTRAPDNLLRLSVGLEHVDDLVEDLDQALGGET